MQVLLPAVTGGFSHGEADTASCQAGSVEGPSDLEPPGSLRFGLEEALELLAALEDARDALIETDHLAEAAQIEHQIQLLSRKLGFDEPGGGRG